MALVDANYCFTFIDVDNYGSNADGTVFSKSEFGQLFLSYQLDILGHKPLPNAPQFGNLPHVIVADEAFPLKPNIPKIQECKKAVTPQTDLQLQAQQSLSYSIALILSSEVDS